MEVLLAMDKILDDGLLVRLQIRLKPLLVNIEVLVVACGLHTVIAPIGLELLLIFVVNVLLPTG